MIRKLSKDKVKSLSDKIGLMVDISAIDYMMTENGQYDLSRSRSFMDYAFADRICIDPRRQSFDEKLQIKKLNNFFDQPVTKLPMVLNI
jgi:hypothetical protein